jgi:hypothetical protein
MWVIAFHRGQKKNRNEIENMILNRIQVFMIKKKSRDGDSNPDRPRNYPAR